MPRRAKPAAVSARTRPFYLIGHNTNSMDEIRRGLRHGLNAFELDINKDHQDQLYVAHDPVNTGSSGRHFQLPPQTVPFFAELKQLLDSPEGQSISLLIFDVKFSQPKLARTLLEQVRAGLTDQGTRIPVIFSTAFLEDAKSLFSDLPAILTDREGLMIDQESNASQVAEFFARHSFPRGCYGDGLTTIPPFGIGLPTPNLPSEFDLAVALKALGQLTFVYPWVLVQPDTMREFLRIGVDGILVDVGLTASTLAQVAAEPEFATKLHRAVRSDDPFWKSSPVTLEVVTGDVSTAGTDSQITLALELKNGATATRAVDGDRAGRFERGTSTNVTLLDLDLELDEIDSITVKQDGSGWASDWYLERINLRQLGKSPKSCLFRKWIPKGKAVRRPCT